MRGRLVSWLAIYTGINRGQCRDFTYSFTRSLARKDTLFDTIAWLDRGWVVVRWDGISEGISHSVQGRTDWSGALQAPLSSSLDEHVHKCL